MENISVRNESEDGFFNDRELLIYEGLTSLALSKNDKYLLNRKILKAKSSSLLEKIKSVRTEKIKLLFKDLEEVPRFPDDFEILKFIRANTAKYCVNVDLVRIEKKEVLSESFLDNLEKKYPAFKDFIGMIRLRPDEEMPEEARKVFWKMLGDKKNFTKEKSC